MGYLNLESQSTWSFYQLPYTVEIPKASLTYGTACGFTLGTYNGATVSSSIYGPARPYYNENDSCYSVVAASYFEVNFTKTNTSYTVNYPLTHVSFWFRNNSGTAIAANKLMITVHTTGNTHSGYITSTISSEQTWIPLSVALSVSIPTNEKITNIMISNPGGGTNYSFDFSHRWLMASSLTNGIVATDTVAHTGPDHYLVFGPLTNANGTNVETTTGNPRWMIQPFSPFTGTSPVTYLSRSTITNETFTSTTTSTSTVTAQHRRVGKLLVGSTFFENNSGLDYLEIRDPLWQDRCYATNRVEGKGTPSANAWTPSSSQTNNPLTYWYPTTNDIITYQTSSTSSTNNDLYIILWEIKGETRADLGTSTTYGTETLPITKSFDTLTFWAKSMTGSPIPAGKYTFVILGQQNSSTEFINNSVVYDPGHPDNINVVINEEIQTAWKRHVIELPSPTSSVRCIALRITDAGSSPKDAMAFYGMELTSQAANGYVPHFIGTTNRPSMQYIRSLGIGWSEDRYAHMILTAPVVQTDNTIEDIYQLSIDPKFKTTINNTTSTSALLERDRGFVVNLTGQNQTSGSFVRERLITGSISSSSSFTSILDRVKFIQATINALSSSVALLNEQKQISGTISASMLMEAVSSFDKTFNTTIQGNNSLTSTQVDVSRGFTSQINPLTTIETIIGKAFELQGSMEQTSDITSSLNAFRTNVASIASQGGVDGQFGLLVEFVGSFAQTSTLSSPILSYVIDFTNAIIAATSSVSNPDLLRDVGYNTNITPTTTTSGSFDRHAVLESTIGGMSSLETLLSTLRTMTSAIQCISSTQSSLSNSRAMSGVVQANDNVSGPLFVERDLGNTSVDANTNISSLISRTRFFNEMITINGQSSINANSPNLGVGFTTNIEQLTTLQSSLSRDFTFDTSIEVQSNIEGFVSRLVENLATIEGQSQVAVDVITLVLGLVSIIENTSNIESQTNLILALQTEIDGIAGLETTLYVPEVIRQLLIIASGIIIEQTKDGDVNFTETTSEELMTIRGKTIVEINPRGESIVTIE